MDYYGQSSAATVPTGRSPTWYEAVNSEFFYEQDQIQKMKSNNQHIYANGNCAGAGVTNATNRSTNVHEQPLVNVVTTAEQQQQQTHTNSNNNNNNNMEYYHRPMSMHFNNDTNSYLPLPPPSAYVGDGNAIVSYPPCQGPRPWNFAQCYGFYGQPACSLLNIIDMEDFM